MKKNVVKDKSFAFALQVLSLSRYLNEEKREYVLSKQVLRSGTAIGALVREAEHGESKADFVHKLSIALKEANETLYWLELLHQGKVISEGQYEVLFGDCDELVRLLVAIVKTSKGIR
jgi:four helix bundle protein